MIDLKTFNSVITESFTPLMRKIGFKGSTGSYYKLENNQLLFCVNIQKNKHGESFSVNLGVHFLIAPFNLNQNITLNKVKEYDCDYRKRLSPAMLKNKRMFFLKATDHWWSYGSTIEQAETNLKNAYELLLNIGNKYFEQFRNYPHPFVDFTLDDIISKKNNNDKYGDITDIRLCLSVLQVKKFFGKMENVDEIIKYGIENTKKGTVLNELFRGYSVNNNAKKLS